MIAKSSFTCAALTALAIGVSSCGDTTATGGLAGTDRLPTSIVLETDSIRFTSLRAPRLVHFTLRNAAGQAITDFSDIVGYDDASLVTAFADSGTDVLRVVPSDVRGTTTVAIKVRSAPGNDGATLGTLKVVIDPVVAKAELHAAFTTASGLAVGESGRVFGVATDSLGNVLPWVSSRDLGVHAESSDPTVAIIESDSMVKALRVGQTDITATMGASSLRVHLPVTPHSALSAQTIVGTYAPVYPLLDTYMPTGVGPTVLVDEDLTLPRQAAQHRITYVDRNGTPKWSGTFTGTNAYRAVLDEPTGALLLTRSQTVFVAVSPTGAEFIHATVDAPVVGLAKAPDGATLLVEASETVVNVVDPTGRLRAGVGASASELVNVVVAGNIVYFVTRTQAFAYPLDGALLWRKTGSFTRAVVDQTGNIYLSTSTSLVSYDSLGAQRWSVALGGEGTLGPSNTVLLKGRDGFLHVLDATSGTELWSRALTSVSYNVVAFGADRVYVGDSYIWTYAARTGEPLGRTAEHVAAPQYATCSNGTLLVTNGRTIYRHDGC